MTISSCDHKMLFNTLFKFSDSHHTVEMRVERSVVHNHLLQLFDLETRCCVVMAWEGVAWWPSHHPWLCALMATTILIPYHHHHHHQGAKITTTTTTIITIRCTKITTTTITIRWPPPPSIALSPPCICLSHPSPSSGRESGSIGRFHRMVPSQKQFVGPFVSRLDSHHQHQLSNQAALTVEPTKDLTIPLKLFIYINLFCETYTKPKTSKLYIRNEKNCLAEREGGQAHIKRCWKFVNTFWYRNGIKLA